MVELHLFVIQSQAKRDRAESIPAQAKTQKSPQGQTQAHAIVPDVVKVNCNPYMCDDIITSLKSNIFIIITMTGVSRFCEFAIY